MFLFEHKSRSERGRGDPATAVWALERNEKKSFHFSVDNADQLVIQVGQDVERMDSLGSSLLEAKSNLNLLWLHVIIVILDLHSESGPRDWRNDL